MFGPFPQEGETGRVELNGVPLDLMEGTYTVEEAPGFAEKLVIGDPKYQDLSYAVSAHAIAAFTGGYGIRRYSDMTFPSVGEENDPTHHHDYLESTDVDCRGVPTILGPLQTALTLPSIIATPVWAGEYVPTTGANAGTRYFVVVAGLKVWRSTDLSTFTDTGIALAANAVQGAVGVFGGKLIIGMGGAAVARFTTDLATLGNVTETGPTNIFVFAFTADAAAAYIAGGNVATEVNEVMASGDQSTATCLFDTATRVVCGSLDNAITALSPGGGITQLFVGKTTELGMITLTTPQYKRLAPFDSYLATNCQDMRWWMGAAGDEQRGPLILMVPRDRSLWAYQPSNQDTGRMENISPWTHENRRPPNIRGRVTAIVGAARWLYYAMQNGAGNTWLIARDARTGANHPIIDLGVNACRSLSISTLGVTNPRLVIGKGNGMVSIILPLDGEMPIDDTAYRHAVTGTLTIPDIDLGLPTEDKIAYSIIVAADNVTTGRTITVRVAFDGGAYSTLGIIDSTPTVELPFVPPTSAKRISVQLLFDTNASTQSPQLLGLVFRASINTKLYRIWTFDARFPRQQAIDIQNQRQVISDYWTFRARGTPVNYIDRWKDSYTVRLFKLREKETFLEDRRAPETVMSFALLSTAAVPFVATPPSSTGDWVLDLSALDATTVLA